MFIINPLSGQRMDGLFSTHPNTENRIAALQAMAQEPGSDAAPRPRVQPRTEQTAPDTDASEGPWDRERERRDGGPAEANPWGRNPTGPRGRKGPWS